MVNLERSIEDERSQWFESSQKDSDVIANLRMDALAKDSRLAQLEAEALSREAQSPERKVAFATLEDVPPSANPNYRR